jgi:putative addiction module killer protein
MALTIREYVTADGRNPFREWLQTLDLSVRARIHARILRFEMDNLGDRKNVGSGVWEARLLFGAGYRIDFGRDGSALIVLLVGGIKSTQRSDIRVAKEFRRDYVEAKRDGTT